MCCECNSGHIICISASHAYAAEPSLHNCFCNILEQVPSALSLYVHVLMLLVHL